MKKIIICLLILNVTIFAYGGTKHVITTVSSISVVEADTLRTVVIIKNVGSVSANLTEQATAEVDGFDLAPGDIYTATERHAKPAINAVTDIGTTTLSVWERKE